MNTQEIEYIGDCHISSSVETPLLANAFDKPDEEKIKNIEKHFAHIMTELGLDIKDDSLSGTPHRVAKMYVKEICSGLSYNRFPKISVFENKMNYDSMVIQKDITFHSLCEHHFVNFNGMAQVAYIPNGKVIGLSKLNRVVNFFARRPQVQERLTLQIVEARTFRHLVLQCSRLVPSLAVQAV